MIKVCHMTSVHTSDDVRIFAKECSSLAKAGFDVYLVAKGESREQNGVKVIGQGKAPNSRIKRMLFFTKKIYQTGLNLNCDIYHIHDPELLPIAIKLVKHGKKVIFDSHEKYSEQLRNKEYLPGIVSKTVSWIYERYESKVLNQIDAVIFPCLYHGKHPFEGKCKITETIDNFPMLSELYDRYDPTAEKDDRSACYVGSITRDRGVTNFIKATFCANGIANLGGVFYSKQYEQELKGMQEYSCVKFYGKLNRQQVLDMLQRSMVGMANIRNVGQYNKYDNLATKVYEYMSLAMPVILSKSEFTMRIVEKYQFGICVDPDSIEETAKAISFLFDNPDEAVRMGLNGRKAVATKFNWETESNKLIGLYNKILSKKDE